MSKIITNIHELAKDLNKLPKLKDQSGFIEAVTNEIERGHYSIYAGEYRCACGYSHPKTRLQKGQALYGAYKHSTFVGIGGLSAKLLSCCENNIVSLVAAKNMGTNEMDTIWHTNKDIFITLLVDFKSVDKVWEYPIVKSTLSYDWSKFEISKTKF